MINNVNYQETYWCDRGKYQAKMDQCLSLIPPKGDSDDFAEQLIISLNRVYYDVYDNGGGNFDVIQNGSRPTFSTLKFFVEWHMKREMFPFLAADYSDNRRTYWDDDDDDDVTYFDFNQENIDDLEELADAVVLYVWEQKFKD
jgi:hypothetical protein